MALIPRGVINVLRTLKEADYSDRAVRLIRTVESDTYSYGKDAYTAGKSFHCRFVPKPSPDALPGADVQITDAELFFGLDTILLPDDRVRITHIFGDKAIGPADYAIVAGPVQDSLGYSATLLLTRD
jgi:hypothetical protein